MPIMGTWSVILVADTRMAEPRGSKWGIKQVPWYIGLAFMACIVAAGVLWAQAGYWLHVGAFVLAFGALVWEALGRRYKPEPTQTDPPAPTRTERQVGAPGEDARAPVRSGSA
jgi:hypothetical protein